MAPRRWHQVSKELYVTSKGVCARCPTCGLMIPLVDESGVDECLCGRRVRVVVEAKDEEDGNE